MPLQRLSIRTTAERLARVEALLRLAGAESTSLRDAGDDAVLEPEPGTTPLWPSVELQALFPASVDVAALAALLDAELPGAIELAGIDELDDADWTKALRQTVEPIAVSDRLVIVADSPDRTALADNELALNMGLAFGTGRHPTTRLCLDWLAAELEAGDTVLDYGCGSGILALAALKLGARHAWATDDDPQALEATRGNAERNALSDALWIGPPAKLPDAQADLVLANILSGALIRLTPALASRQRETGRIVLSGVLTEQAHAVTAAYAPYYRNIDTQTLDGWCRLTGTRVPTSADAPTRNR